MKRVKILLIGVGGYGGNYIKELTEKNVTSAVIVGICEVMEDVEERYPVIRERGIPIYRTPEAFYQEHRADLAVISTPIHLHQQQIAVCLRNGSHVLAEKPVCTSMEGAEKLAALAEETGKFVAVGYQMNYSGDVLAMKRDIVDGKFGRPILMKTLHAVKRGDRYYGRNNWAGKISIDSCRVNDSPFTNSCAHQFQLMTFLLGDGMDRAAELSQVEAELYRGNRNVENFDTAAVRAVTEGGVPLYYYTSHCTKEQHFGPMAEYRFERAVIYYGRDFGGGPVSEYIVEWKDGSRSSYGEIPKGERLQKLYDAIECAAEGGHPVSTIQCAIPHLRAVERLAELPIYQIREEELEHVTEDGEHFCRIRNLNDVFITCFENQQMPSQTAGCWREKVGRREGKVRL